MRLKYWAFLILLAVDLILWLLAFYDPEPEWVYFLFSWGGFGLLLGFILFLVGVSLLAEIVEKRIPR